MIYVYIFYVALLKMVGQGKELHFGFELISGAVWFKIFILPHFILVLVK